MSNILISCWLMSDMCNITAAFVLDYLLTQKILSVWWGLADILMFTTHFVFKYSHRKYSQRSTRVSVLEGSFYAFLLLTVVTNIIWFGLSVQSLYESAE